MSNITQQLNSKHNIIDDKGLKQILQGALILIFQNLLIIFMFFFFGAEIALDPKYIELNPFVTDEVLLLSLFIVLLSIDIIGMLYLGLGFLNSEIIRKKNNGKIRSIFILHLTWICAIIVNRVSFIFYMNNFDFDRELSDLTGEDIFLSSIIAFSWAIAQLCLTISSFLITKIIYDLYTAYLYFFIGYFISNFISLIFLSFLFLSVLYETFLVVLTDSSTAYASYFPHIWNVMNLTAVLKMSAVPLLAILMLRQLRLTLIQWELTPENHTKKRYFAIDR